MTDHNRTEGTDSGGSHAYNQEATQDERLAEVWRDRKVLADRKGGQAPPRDRGWQGSTAPPTSTYFAQAQMDEDEIGGGRWAPKRGPDPMPQQPPHSPWAVDHVGIEMPLGERVDALPDMITIDGFNARGLPDWQYGNRPSEEHASYTQPLEPSASGCPSSWGILTPENPETATLSIAGAVSGLPINETEPQPLSPNLRRI
jgi:hypothetical protein